MKLLPKFLLYSETSLDGMKDPWFRIRIRSDPVFLPGSGYSFQISVEPDPVSVRGFQILILVTKVCKKNLFIRKTTLEDYCCGPFKNEKVKILRHIWKIFRTEESESGMIRTRFLFFSWLRIRYKNTTDPDPVCHGRFGRDAVNFKPDPKP